MVIIGGMGSIMGSFFGAAFIVLLPTRIFSPAACEMRARIRPHLSRPEI